MFPLVFGLNGQARIGAALLVRLLSYAQIFVPAPAQSTEDRAERAIPILSYQWRMPARLLARFHQTKAPLRILRAEFIQHCATGMVVSNGHIPFPIDLIEPIAVRSAVSDRILATESMQVIFGFTGG
ncbi:hypothetical protein WK53_33870 [Burkholderia ubonensis]|uniref:Uncharacterized protein n=1 Tax=Burkholderia ubonensis TaxID=101571 RepID=A0AAW3NGC4_9BURK|nr:hypothetical protein WK53_33870 [Burkholderia ubonensis]